MIEFLLRNDVNVASCILFAIIAFGAGLVLGLIMNYREDDDED